MLLLFDIDGTLLAGAAEAHRDALHATLREVYGLAAPETVVTEVAGRTDVDIARELLRRSGIADSVIDERAGLLRDTWVREHEARVDADLRHTVVPGIEPLLRSLHGRSEVRLSLLTGNLEQIARSKLGRAGIGHYFEAGQGAFGSDGERRADLPAIARARAGTNGEPWPRERTIVIGDTPRDIACARADGVRCVGVATGWFGVDELADADVVARDARELDAALAQLLR